MTTSSGPTALRWLRRRSGLTQHELAVRSGVSERTIRAMERGRVATPHPASLEALAEASALLESDRKTFLQAWRPARFQTFMDLTRAFHPIDDLMAEITLRTAVDQHLIANWDRLRVQENRVRTSIARRVLEAQTDGVDSHLEALTYDVSEEQPEIETRVRGAHLRHQYNFPERGLIVFEIGYPRVLSRGDIAAFTLETTLRGSPPTDYAEETEIYGMAQVNATPVNVLEVAFEGPRPSAIRQIEILADGTKRHIDSLAPDEDGIVRQVLRYRPPGSYGFDWPHPVGAGDP